MDPKSHIHIPNELSVSSFAFVLQSSITNHGELPSSSNSAATATATAIMAAVSTFSMIQLSSPSASSIAKLDHCQLKIKPSSLSLNLNGRRKMQLSLTRRPLPIQAAHSDGGKPSCARIFVGGFVLGGLIVGTLGCMYAPQISEALAGADRKELMRKLPKFIYDEEKALEKTRKILAEKIAQLNSAIDDVSAQLRSGEAPNGLAVNSDEIEAAK